MSSGSGKAVAAGTVTIAATHGAQNASLSLSVVDGTLITPSTSTLAVNATTNTFTVTCRKANGTTDASPTYTATSTNTGVATVSQSGTTVTVTAVANGSCSVNLSYTDVAGTSTASVSVTVTGVSGGGGSPPTIGAQGQGIMGASATAIPISGVWDAARLYTGSGYASRDDQWHKLNFQNTAPASGDTYYYNSASPTLGGQGASTALYKYGSCFFIDLATLVDSGRNGIPAFRCKIAPPTTPGNSASCPQFIASIPNTRRLWYGRRITHLLGSQTPDGQNWDVTGSECVNSANVSFNSGQGAGFKHGPFTSISGFVSSRVGMGGIGNCTFTGGQMAGGLFLDGYAAGANGTVGFTDSGGVQSSTIDSAFYDGYTYDEVVFSELFSNGTHDYIATRYWRRRVNLDFSVGPWVRVDSYNASPMTDGTNWYDGRFFNTIEYTSKNHNRAIEVPRYREMEEWTAYDADSVASDCSDPWGCLAADAAHAPKTPWGNTLASQTSTTATFNVVRNKNTYPYDGGTPSYVAKLRAVIDGVDQPSANDYAIPAWYPDEDPNNAGRDAIPVTLTLSSGAHTVAFKGVNAAGTLVSSASPSVNVTI